MRALVWDNVATPSGTDDGTDPAVRQRCTGAFSHGQTPVIVGQDSDGQLTLTFGSQLTSKLRPYQGRTFVIDPLEGFRVEFNVRADGEIDQLTLHQPNGT